MHSPRTTSAHLLNILREIAHTLNAAWDLDTALDLIARKTTEVMRVDSCTIYLLDPDGVTLRLRTSTGLSRRALGRSILRIGEGMTGYAVQANKLVHAADAHEHPHFKPIDEAHEMAFCSLLAVPMVVEAEPIGALNVQTIERHLFTQDEIAIIALIGDLAAGALAKAQLYDKQKRQIEEMRALAQVSEAMTSPQYLDDILDVVTEMAAKMLNAAVCSLFLLDESNQELALRSAKRTTSPYRHRPPLALGHGLIGQVMLTGKPIYSADVRVDGRYLGGALARDEGLVSLLAVPLSVREQVIGVLCCYTAYVHAFSEEQKTLLTTLANQTALAIQNAHLVTNTAVIREMHHRIKNNLQTVAMLMQLQIADASKLDTRRVLETNIHRIRSIAAVHEVLSERGFRLVDVKNVLERIIRTTVEAMVQSSDRLEIEVYGEALLLPSRPATALMLVVNELVQNALEHAFSMMENGRIEVSLGRSPDEFIVIVRDDGVGLPADYTRGLGLEIVETLVTDDLNGRLKFNCFGRGTEVVLRMPRSILK